MKIEGLTLTAFGRFRGQRIDLRPGLNLIYGLNESGKTTIQKFLLGMLYGFKKGSIRREYTEDAHRYRPWHGEEYRGALTYSLDRDGSRYRVERDFDPARESVRVYDAVTGADLTTSFGMDRRKELLFAEEHLRIPAEVFTSTAWVGQMEVGRLEMGRELVQRVANLSESGREDLSVRAALRQIDDRIRAIGSDRAPTKPYARLAREIAAKRAELERAARVREQCLEWEVGLQEARSAVARLEAQIAEAQRLLTWSLLAEEEERQQRVQASTAQMEAARQLAQQLSAYASFPVDLAPALREWQSQAAQASAALAQQRARLAELAEAKAALERRAAAYAGIERLGPDAAARVEAATAAARTAAARLPELRQELGRIDEMIARIDEAIAPLTGVTEAGEEALEEIDRLDREIGAVWARLNQPTVERLRGDVARLEQELRSLSGTGWLALSILLAAVAAAAYLVPGVIPTAYLNLAVGGAGGLALVAMVPYLAARRSRAQVERFKAEAEANLKAAETALRDDTDRIHRMEKQRDQAMRRLGVLSVGELRNQVVRYEQLTARRDGQAMRRETLLAEIHRAEQEAAAQQERARAILSSALGEEAAERLPDGDALERLQEAVAQYQAIRFELDAVNREAQELERRSAAEEERLAVARAECEVILQEAGVPDAAAFEAACAQHEEWRRAEREAEGLRTALQTLLGGAEPGPAELERLRSLVRGERPEITLASGVIQTEIRRLEAERSEWHSRASDLAARIETAAAESDETADLERELQALREEKLTLESELEALELARSVIGEVSSQIHREFAPRLNQTMGEIISRLTLGRYRTVRVDEELTIRAIADGDRTVPITSLSGGTVDQFYLALRVAILDLLTEGQERIPLLLDDPFVQYDSDRLQSAMAYLAHLSKERQVVLMTCHRREVEWGRALGAHLIELNGAEERGA